MKMMEDEKAAMNDPERMAKVKKESHGRPKGDEDGHGSRHGMMDMMMHDPDIKKMMMGDDHMEKK